ncbi:MAG: hypothetical protein AUJ98_00305 [Bacteroidetes bacterium CG2_30_33_31]|nr:MAG: hypothetical protein AUJ98_00305 [Bacteroidetes bacterium CG2_30_33_31]
MLLYKNVSYIILLMAILFSGCIKYYEPNYYEGDDARIVVNGVIKNIEGYQYVYINKTSPLNKYSINPMVKCKVEIIDSLGNSFPLDEFEDGKYRIWLGQQYLTVGNSYKLKIQTADGEFLESEFEKIHQAVAVDSIYFETKTIILPNVSNPLYGAQFYIDFDAGDSPSEFFLWNIEETWEKHASRPIEWWYDGHVHHQVPPDYSKMLCYQTEIIPDIFTLTTKNLSPKVYKKYPLHFVSTQSQRLNYLYSILINQYSVTQTTFDYWQKMKENGLQQGGLYSKQPISVRGNITNLTHPEKVVLGIFSAVGASQKRIFIQNVAGLITDFNPCQSSSLRRGVRDISPYDYPAYLDGNDFNYYNVQLSPGCVDCTRNGGTTTKPVFWP